MNKNDKIEIIFWVAVLAFVVTLLGIAKLTSRLNNVEAQLSKIEKIEKVIEHDKL